MILYIGRNKTAEFEDMRDADTGDILTPDDGWSASWELRQDNTVLGSGSMTYTAPDPDVPGSKPVYSGTIPDTLTSTLVNGTTYTVRGIFTNGSTTENHYQQGLAVPSP